jgi:DNA-directed RNA polymerase specialized sigma24 family protein
VDPDDELLRRSAKTPEALGAFYERHERMVLGSFVRRTRDAELAADLAAETVAAALLSARRYRPGGAPASAWLLGIAHHVLSGSLRRSRVEDRARRKLGMPPLALDDDALERIEPRAGDAAAHLRGGRMTRAARSHASAGTRLKARSRGTTKGRAS